MLAMAGRPRGGRGGGHDGTWPGGKRATGKEPVAMAFLYAKPSIGAAGVDPEDPRVIVEDIPEIKVVSIGLRGSYDKATFDRGATQLETWLKEHPEWKAAGDLRTLGYNSPFVPGLMKYSEAQIPIEPTVGE
jgi:hypothetical protein